MEDPRIDYRYEYVDQLAAANAEILRLQTLSTSHEAWITILEAQLRSLNELLRDVLFSKTN